MTIKRSVWFICGVLAFIVGLIGAFLPLLPTVPLMILAAFCFANSSKKAHDWLINNSKFGPQIKDWRERGVIALRAKISATVFIVASVGLSVVFGVPPQLMAVQIMILIGVTLFIWSRPSG